MRKKRTNSNDNLVIKMLSKEIAKSNKGRNRILLGAVILCIVTLTMVFSISCGKIQAEYTKSIRKAGMIASTIYENADQAQYEQVKTLLYIKQVGRRAEVGNVELEEQPDCSIQWLDKNAWDELVSPAYTEIHGTYPEKENELMLSISALKAFQINEPKVGMEIELEVHLGVFRTKQTTFKLSGWYSDYVENSSKSYIGYISKEKMKAWGYEVDEKADLLICQSNNMQWQETEEHLYKDVPTNSSGQKIKASNTYTYNAVNQLAGGYELAILGAIVTLAGLFFLIQNVLRISMTRDIRQLGLLNTIGATRKQIKRIYYKQIQDILISGSIMGLIISISVLLFAIPRILGEQYLQEVGGATVLFVFKPWILVVAVASTVLLVVGIATYIIIQVVNISSVESMHFTAITLKKRHNKKRECKRKTRRGENGELRYLAWQNVIRYRSRFLFTVFSLFLGMGIFLAVIVITSGSDYENVIDPRPDFVIAGRFSAWGQESGYGNEYQTRDAGEDPMKTDGDTFALLYANEYDEFSPISADVKEQLLNVDGVNKKTSYVMEGAYMLSVISAKGIRPFEDENKIVQEDTPKKAGVGYYGSEYEMVEGFDSDIIQILNESEIAALKKYIEQNQLPVDMNSLENGTGVMILHDHKLSPKQEKQAEESVGQPVYFKSMLTRNEKEIWNQASTEERDESERVGEVKEKKSDEFVICGYLDNQVNDFPNIRQSWHGAEGDIYYLISEEGFNKLPTEKKILYMELNVNEGEETEAQNKIQSIVAKENQNRLQTVGTAVDDDSAEAGIFFIGKSDILAKAANYIRGNRMILGSIGAVLLLAGFMNYFNVMMTGIISRKRELEIMHSIGLTDKQKRKLLVLEGGYYCAGVTFLLCTMGTISLQLISMYMKEKLSYFVYYYPWKWMLILVFGMWSIGLLTITLLCKRKD